MGEGHALHVRGGEAEGGAERGEGVGGAGGGEVDGDGGAGEANKVCALVQCGSLSFSEDHG